MVVSLEFNLEEKHVFIDVSWHIARKHHTNSLSTPKYRKKVSTDKSRKPQSTQGCFHAKALHMIGHEKRALELEAPTSMLLAGAAERGWDFMPG